MKKRIIVIIAIVLIVVIAGVVFLCLYNKDTEKTIWYKSSAALSAGTDAYDYSALEDYKKEERSVNQYDYYDVPEEQSKQMSTQGLVITSLDYPMIGSLYFFDSYRKGFDVLKSVNSSIFELTQRDNAFEILASFYDSVSLSDIIETDDMKNVRLIFLEMLISDDDVLQHSSSADRKSVIKNAIMNLIENEELLDDKFNIIVTCQMIGKILYTDSSDFQEMADNDVNIKDFIEGNVNGVSEEVTLDTVQKIINIATEYVGL